MSSLIENRVCIVTGAGKGIGRAIAEKFYAEGANLSLITRSADDIESLYETFGEDNPRIMAVSGDVSDPNMVGRFVQNTTDKFKTIDVLINNAGMRFRKKFSEISEEEFRKVFDVNVMSMVMLCQGVLPIMSTNKSGKIINMSSVAGTHGLPELSAYVASKAAIIGLTKSLALEYAGHNIQINAIAPGFCKTSYFEDFRQKQELYEFTLDRTPMGRWGESNEVADVCLFLASGLSSYVTGEVINVDGGWSAW